MTVSVVVCNGIQELGKATLGRVHGPVCAVSGGSTYEALFRHWSGPALQGVSFIPVDERMVGLSEVGSNWMVAIRLLLDPNGIGHQGLHWTPSASHLDSLVHRLMPEYVGQIPLIPQVWLGMGDDGHTASLFPNGLELSDTSSLALATVAPKTPHPRVTLGLGALRAAQDLCVVVTGAAKGPMLRRVLDGDSSLPLALVLQGREATLFVDSDCAKSAGV